MIFNATVLAATLLRNHLDFTRFLDPVAEAVAGDVSVQSGLRRLVVDTRLFRFVVRCERKQGGLLAELCQLVEAKEKAGLAQTTRSSCASLEG